MSQWPGDPGRKPSKPAGSGFDKTPPDNQRVRKPIGQSGTSGYGASESSYDAPYDDINDMDDDLTAPRGASPSQRMPSRPGRSTQSTPRNAQSTNTRGSFVDRGVKSFLDSNNASESGNITRIEIGKRAVAFIIDFLACYMAAVVVMLVPFVNRFLDLNLVLMMIFLTRDFPFEGRGIGKNVMGLQVIDRTTGRPASLLQSVQRNIILIAPNLAFQVIALGLRIVPVSFINHFVEQIVNIVGTFYYIIVLPLEAYRAYSRADGMRMGDDIAGTELTESAMDFSKPLPRE